MLARDVEHLEVSCIAHGKTMWQFLKNLNIALPYSLAIPLLDVYPSEMKYEDLQGTCMQRL